MDTRCPRCQNQQTTKATAVINAGNTLGITSGSGTGLSIGMGGIAPTFVNYNSTTHMQSMLASKLRPPQPPRKTWPVSNTFAIIFGALNVFPLAPLGLAWVLMATPSDTNGMSAAQKAAALSAEHSMFNISLTIILCLLAIMALNIVLTVITAPRRKARYQEQLAHWQHAMYNWDQLYYCGTCDSVYLQHNRRVAPLDALYGLLYSA